MNEKTYHISPKKLAEAEAFTAGIYRNPFLKQFGVGYANRAGKQS
jgi:hypothetical protein